MLDLQAGVIAEYSQYALMIYEIDLHLSNIKAAHKGILYKLRIMVEDEASSKIITKSTFKKDMDKIEEAIDKLKEIQ